jgi:hypothetical protein
VEEEEEEEEEPTSRAFCSSCRRTLAVSIGSVAICGEGRGRAAGQTAGCFSRLANQSDELKRVD